LGFKALVESVMRSPAVIASFYDPVSTIVEKMILNNVGAVIIIREGLKVGIVTERDLVEKVMNKKKDPKKTFVYEVLSSPIITIEFDRSVGDAFELMRKNNIRRLAVVKNEKLVGIVTERRLLESLSKLIR
jgi:signal-transduction protein with cAMP-binding, CBS, and nucleotidyltransferase domain